MENELPVKKNKTKLNIIVFEILAVALFIIMAIAITPKEFQNDTFYTIKCGEYIYQNGISDLTQDTFSWHELPYTYPHWLYDSGIYLIYLYFGLNGIYISTVIFAAILGYMIYKTSEVTSKNKVISLVISFLALYSMNPYITARAQLVTFVLFEIELYIIEKLLQTQNKKYLGFLILIPLLITQLHCAVFPMFFVLALPYIAEYILLVLSDLAIIDRIIRRFFIILKKIIKKETIREKFDRLIEKADKIISETKTNNEIKRNNPYKIIRSKNKIMISIIIVILVAIGTGLLNPTGTGAYTYILKTYKGNTTGMINEHLPLTLVDSREFSIALILLSIILIFTDAKIRLSDCFMLGGLIFLSFKSTRQISLFIIMCTPILVRLITYIWEKYDKKTLENLYKYLSSITGALVIILVVFIFGRRRYNNNIKCQEFINEASYPVTASTWIKENLDLENLKLFNEYNYGSYLLYQDIPVFIDSRCDLYTPQFNNDENMDVFSDAVPLPDLNNNYEEIFEKYEINYAMFYKEAKICQVLNENEKYENVYEDDYFMIYKINK